MNTVVQYLIALFNFLTVIYGIESHHYLLGCQMVQLRKLDPFSESKMAASQLDLVSI